MVQNERAQQPELIRGVGFVQATTLNMIDMIGVGPFITIPLIISAAGGPQAMLGWIFGALFALSDGWCGPNWVPPCPTQVAPTNT